MLNKGDWLFWKGLKSNQMAGHHAFRFNMWLFSMPFKMISFKYLELKKKDKSHEYDTILLKFIN